MYFDELENILRISWNAETCCPPLRDKYDGSNPSLGQCAITTLIVHDFIGGKIMRCMTKEGSHYYNRIGDTIIDLTKDQFNGEFIDYKNSEERTREYLLSNEDTKNRYLLLQSIVKDNFNKNIYQRKLVKK